MEEQALTIENFYNWDGRITVQDREGRCHRYVQHLVPRDSLPFGVTEPLPNAAPLTSLRQIESETR